MEYYEWGIWIRIARDLIMVGLGTFMLVYETVFVNPPNLEVLSVGAALLGVPMVVRLDLWASGKGNGRGQGEEERWSHLP